MKKYIYIFLGFVFIYILISASIDIILFMVDNYEIFIIAGLISIAIQIYLFKKYRN